jgi:hypothetical protein
MIGYQVLAGGIDAIFVQKPSYTYNATTSLTLRALARQAANVVVEADFAIEDRTKRSAVHRRVGGRQRQRQAAPAAGAACTGASSPTSSPRTARRSTRAWRCSRPPSSRSPATSSAPGRPPSPRSCRTCASPSIRTPHATPHPTLLAAQQLPRPRRRRPARPVGPPARGPQGAAAPARAGVQQRRLGQQLRARPQAGRGRGRRPGRQGHHDRRPRRPHRPVAPGDRRLLQHVRRDMFDRARPAGQLGRPPGRVAPDPHRGRRRQRAGRRRDRLGDPRRRPGRALPDPRPHRVLGPVRLARRAHRLGQPDRHAAEPELRAAADRRAAAAPRADRRRGGADPRPRAGPRRARADGLRRQQRVEDFISSLGRGDLLREIGVVGELELARSFAAQIDLAVEALARGVCHSVQLETGDWDTHTDNDRPGPACTTRSSPASRSWSPPSPAAPAAPRAPSCSTRRPSSSSPSSAVRRARTATAARTTGPSPAPCWSAAGSPAGGSSAPPPTRSPAPTSTSTPARRPRRQAPALLELRRRRARAGRRRRQRTHRCGAPACDLGLSCASRGPWPARLYPPGRRRRRRELDGSGEGEQRQRDQHADHRRRRVGQPRGAPVPARTAS